MFNSFVTKISSELFCDDKSYLSIEEHLVFIGLCRSIFSKEDALANFIESFIIHFDSENLPRGRSLKHENGFIKISLLKLSNGAQLRLHVYPTGEFVDSTIHAHRWDLSSYVIDGHLNCINYSFQKTDSGGDMLLDLSDESDGVKSSSVKYIGQALPESSYDVVTGSGHFLDYRKLHRVSKSAGAGAITLMLSGPPRADSSTISAKQLYQPVERTFMGIEEIRQSLTKVQNILY